tara:strand:+ start:704 stop:949 length:246 start_codon:yes stop_codon:yes gene_type:complete
MDYQNKEHMDKVMTEYTKLPDTDMTHKELYEKIVKLLNKYQEKTTNGEILHTLKLVSIQLCEACIVHVEGEQYSELQEKYK